MIELLRTDEHEIRSRASDTLLHGGQVIVHIVFSDPNELIYTEVNKQGGIRLPRVKLQGFDRNYGEVSVRSARSYLTVASLGNVELVQSDNTSFIELMGVSNESEKGKIIISSLVDLSVSGPDVFRSHRDERSSIGGKDHRPGQWQSVDSLLDFLAENPDEEQMSYATQAILRYMDEEMYEIIDAAHSR